MTYVQSSQIPPVFTSVPLKCVMLLVHVFRAPRPDTVDFANKTVLSWAQRVPTLKHTIMDFVIGSGMWSLDQEEYGWEVVRTKDGRVELMSLTSDGIDEIREGCNLWD
jgi:hypothetical protein